MEMVIHMGKTKDIRQAVEAELAFDTLVDAEDITVVNMNGDVGLNGTVLSYPPYLEASVAAQRVAVVKNVHNHPMKVPASPGRVHAVRSRPDGVSSARMPRSILIYKTTPSAMSLSAVG